MSTALASVFAQGVDASKPAATSGNNGYFYLSTDINGGTLYQSNGTTWVPITTGVSAVKVAGLTGAVAAARFAGGTTSGAPGSGTFAVGDFVVDHAGAIWVCTVAGSPGTWVSASGSGVTSITGTSNEIIASASTGSVTLSTPQAIATSSSPTFATVTAGGITGAVAASRYAGATASGAPASGTFLLGDFVIDQTGKVWVCTTAGSPGTWTQVGGSGSGGLTSLGSSVLGSSATTISVSGIAGTKTHLKIIALIEMSAGAAIGMQFNGDTASNYSSGNASEFSSAWHTADPATAAFLNLAGAGTSFELLEMTVPAYTGATRKPGFWKFSGGWLIGSGSWSGTAAITQVTLMVQSGGATYQTGSGLWVYGF